MVKIIMNSKKYFPWDQEQQKNVHLTTFIQYILEVLATVTKQEKDIKGIQIGKEEVKLSLFADYLILCIGKPKDASKKLITNKRI